MLWKVALFAVVSAAADEVQCSSLRSENPLVCSSATVQLLDCLQHDQRSCPIPTGKLQRDSEGVVVQFPGRGQCAAATDAARRAPCTLVQSTAVSFLPSAAVNTPCCSELDACEQSGDGFYCLPFNPAGASHHHP